MLKCKRVLYTLEAGEGKGIHMRTIKAKIIILLIICTIISTVICGGLTLTGMLSVSNQNASKIMALECNNSSREINATLSRVEQSVDTLAEVAEQSLTDLQAFRTDAKYVET